MQGDVHVSERALDEAQFAQLRAALEVGPAAYSWDQGRPAGAVGHCLIPGRT